MDILPDTHYPVGYAAGYPSKLISNPPLIAEVDFQHFRQKKKKKSSIYFQTNNIHNQESAMDPEEEEKEKKSSIYRTLMPW